MPTRHHIVSVLVDGMSALEPAVAQDFLADRQPNIDVPWYRYTVASEGGAAVRLHGGFHMDTSAGLEALRTADTVLIPGWCGIHTTTPSPALVEALRDAHRRGARMVSFCTGAFALAAAGILDGRPATTHWSSAAELQRRHPAVQVDPSVLYVDDGDVLTSAGSAASVDLALHLIRTDFGAEIANLVARYMVVPPHRDGGQAQFIESPVPSCAESDTLATTLDWARARLDQPLSVTELADAAAMSPRNFTRRFRAATGASPHQWLTGERLALAQELLETTDDPVERIAEQCGFGTAASLRTHFTRRVKTTPQRYRQMFRAARVVRTQSAV